MTNEIQTWRKQASKAFEREQLVDDRTYYVTIRVEGAEAPVWRSHWLTREQAAALLAQKREEVRQARWTHRVQAFYRDGSIAKFEVAS